jgi:hypothetical protein
MIANHIPSAWAAKEFEQPRPAACERGMPGLVWAPLVVDS